jgi:hypothetical protein
MKTLIAVLALTCSTAFAFELDATEALLNTLPVGDYSGLGCSVSVRNLGNKVVIEALNDKMRKTSEVLTGAVYRANPANRSFLATVSSGESKENIFRTIAVTQNTQYVVVSDVTSDGRQMLERKVECIIDL